MLTIKHSSGIFTHAHPKSLRKKNHLDYEDGDTSRPFFEIQLPDGSVEVLRFNSLEEGAKAERLAHDAIYPEPNYSSAPG